MDSIHELTELFRRFPGIGPRQARRFVYFLLEQCADAKQLSALAEKLSANAVRCGRCRRFFAKEGAHTLCRICRDKHRDAKTLLVVARDSDLEAIEKSGSYRGGYFVLGGTLSFTDTEPQKWDALAALSARAAAGVPDGLAEIVLALSANPEGEHTAEAAARALAPFAKKHSIKISTLGRGLSTGAELEYCDAETLKNALKNRM